MKKNIITREIELRVRYKDTDTMGIVHHANFITFYEVARTEMMRAFGRTYREMEDSGVMMPILGVDIEYFSPAYYDDVLTIKVMVPELPKVRMTFDHEIYNEEGTLLNKGRVVTAFVNGDTRRATRAPRWFVELLEENMDR